MVLGVVVFLAPVPAVALPLLVPVLKPPPGPPKPPPGPPKTPPGPPKFLIKKLLSKKKQLINSYKIAAKDYNVLTQ